MVDIEITALWEKMNSVEQKLGKVIDMLNDKTQIRITESEEALCDVDENFTERIDAVEEALCELSERVESEV